MVFEPIAPYAAMLMSLKMARLADSDVEQAVQTLDANGKKLKSSDIPGWTALYGEALALIPKVLAAQSRQEAQRSQAQDTAAKRQALQSAGGQVQSGLQRAAADWNGRLNTQVQDLSAKVDRSTDKLVATTHDDIRSGETVYHFEEDAVREFETWLRNAMGQWRTNNQALVAQRANEALAPARAHFGASVSFEVTEPVFTTPALQPLRLNGYCIQTPGKLDFLGVGYKATMTTVMSASMLLGLVSQKIISGVSSIAPYLFGTVFVGAVAYAVVTVPKKKRQAEYRLLLKAKTELQRELAAEVSKRLKQCADQQSSEIKKHLDAQWLRWTELTRSPGGDATPMGMAAAMSGLMPADVARLQGEWRLAIEARIAELAAAG